MTIFGWDASDFDWGRGPMDLDAAKADGISFVSHKITEMWGSGSVTHRFGDFARRAKTAGFQFIGAYVVPRTPGRSLQAQVDFAIQTANTQWPEWKTFPGFFWQMDSEHWSYDAVPLWVGTDMSRLLEQQTGKKVLHYASVGHYGSAWNQPYPRWNPNYWLFAKNMHYREYYSRSGGDQGPGWVGSAKIWQYTDSAKIGSQNVIWSDGRWVGSDANAYKGTEADFAAMIGADGTVPEYIPPSSPDDSKMYFYLGD